MDIGTEKTDEVGREGSRVMNNKQKGDKIRLKEGNKERKI